MRRQDRALTAEETGALLSRGRFATVGLGSPADGPYVVTLSYGYDAEARTLYFHVARDGRKLDLIAEDPRACATVVEAGAYLKGECAHPYESVVCHGTMREVTDADELVSAMRTLLGQQEDDPAGAWERNALGEEATWKRFRFLALDIDDISGKRGS
jgi:nitroimidazol reductase NimA-like FMN-containing flavoprotein (pyridoxamine 5'-phosphate oxidase superfamily)